MAALLLVTLLLLEPTKLGLLILCSVFLAWLAVKSGSWLIGGFLLLVYVGGVLVVIVYLCSFMRGDVGDVARVSTAHLFEASFSAAMILRSVVAMACVLLMLYFVVRGRLVRFVCGVHFPMP